MVRASLPDPVEIHDRLWQGFRGRVGWDVGANCGQTILDMAFEFDHIVAFEPSPDSFAAAASLVIQHHIEARVINVALSDHDGHVDLAYPAAEQRETGQLVTPGLKGMEWEPADWDAVEKVSVSCLRADVLAIDWCYGGEELMYPDFMKVDTEGHEVAVLRGAEGILARGSTDFLIEFHSPENQRACMEILVEAGYEPEIVRHPHYPSDSLMWYQHGWLRAFAPRGKRAR